MPFIFKELICIPLYRWINKNLFNKSPNGGHLGYFEFVLVQKRNMINILYFWRFIKDNCTCLLTLL